MATRAELNRLTANLVALRDDLHAAVEAQHARIAAVHPLHRESAVNLIHYVELRRHDIRAMQEELAGLGLCSLGRAEPHVMATLTAVIAFLQMATGQDQHEASSATLSVAPETVLERNTRQLLGAVPASRSTRIMVTLPSEAADEAALVGSLVTAGMDVARVNCAHDDREAWAAMIHHVRDHGRPQLGPCMVAMDLAGPKLRTGALQPGPQVVRIAPTRDASGVVTAHGLAWLTATGAPFVCSSRTRGERNACGASSTSPPMASSQRFVRPPTSEPALRSAVSNAPRTELRRSEHYRPSNSRCACTWATRSC